MLSNKQLAPRLGYTWRRDLFSGCFVDVSVVEKNEDPEKLQLVMKTVKQDLDRNQREFTTHMKANEGTDHIIKMIAMEKVGLQTVFFIELGSMGDLHHVIFESPAVVPCHRYFQHLIVGLQHMHSKDIIHLDIKPENLFISANTIFSDVLKIGDFGLARSNKTDNGDEIMLERSRGTHGYMAPEILVENSRWRGPPVDIWAAGIVLMNMLTKNEPWKDAEERDVQFKMYSQNDLNRMKFHWGGLGNATTLVLKMLDCNPANRASFQFIRNHVWFKQND
ncbi:hypothetical protein B9Z55_026653 [Caenorhabditis nigoni]|uniref:Protein kinase domain-containing protein n=1 Tax=Caenorhabditis nigoni TaxID=1611254 RepID=A0A2G5T420_9PELO|nr:hypothetical protein B9Z55_026653 [Caenorhabditis nigoni]